MECSRALLLFRIGKGSCKIRKVRDGLVKEDTL